MILVICIIILCILIYNLYKQDFDNIEGFTITSENKIKAQQLWQNRHLFNKGFTYSSIKKHIEWVDPVIYDEIYQESKNNKLTESFLMNMNY